MTLSRYLAFFGALLFAFCATLARAATTHSATLTWTAPADATSSSTITVFRANAACSTNPTFTQLATGVSMFSSGSTTTGSYVDTTVTVGTWCYTVQQDQNGATSVNSNLAPVSVSPLPPTTLTVVAQ